MARPVELMALAEDDGGMTNEDNTAFLAAVLGDPPDGPINLFAVNPTTGARVIRWSTSPTDLHRQAVALADDHNVWFGVAPRRARTNGRGRSDDCTTIGGLWADLDVTGPGHARTDLIPTLADAYALIDQFPLRPSAILETGGGLQAWWLLTERLPAGTAAPLLARWAAWWIDAGERHGWHIDNTWDIARVLRVPGTWNRKTSQPRPVDLTEWDPAATYGHDDIDQWLPDVDTEPPSERIPYIGPTRPGDHFNAEHQCGPILQQHGWTFHHQDRNGDEHWVRPGKDRRQGAGATIYAADGRAVIWTDAAPPLRQKAAYDPFGLYVALEHRGDFHTATKTLRANGYGEQPINPYDLFAPVDTSTASDEPLAPEAPAELPVRLIEWDTFWATEHAGEDWLVEPFLARARQTVLYALTKAGKSLLALEVAAAVATGRPVLDRPVSPPVHVLYLDYEMTENDLRERLEALGYGPGDDLSHFHYALLPNIAPLDTPEGGRAIIELLAAVHAELVVIDTFGRAVQGEENASDTIRAYYRNTGVHLKAANATVLRSDHQGKDESRGQRGTSAKNEDVDVVWHLAARDPDPDGVSIVKLTLGYSRVGWAPQSIDLRRETNPNLRHIQPLTGSWPAGTKEAADLLDRFDAPIDVSKRKASNLLRDHGWRGRNEVLGAAVRYRRQRAAQGLEDVAPRVGDHPGDHPPGPARDHSWGPAGTTHEEM